MDAGKGDGMDAGSLMFNHGGTSVSNEGVDVYKGPKAIFPRNRDSKEALIVMARAKPRVYIDD